MLGRIKSGKLIAIVAATAACAVGAVAAGTAAAASKVVTAPRITSHLTFRGTVNLTALAARSGPATTSSAPRRASPLRQKSRPPSAAIRAANPDPGSRPLRSLTGPPLGFVGLTAADSGAVNGFDLEPPDQGLCATGNTVMEPVNLALSVYTESGITLLHPVSLNSFFGLAPAVSNNGRTTTFGPSLSDPRCYYDAQTQRWFVTILEIDVNPTTGAFGYRSSELIAVSQTSDPTGSYGLFSIDATNDGSDGTPSQPNCPCLGDQPRIGADANGFYISTDSYPIQGLFNSNGGMVYAMSKQGLAAAATGSAPPPPVVSIDIGAVIIGGYPANAVQPAETPQGGRYATDREYFLSTPDFNGFATAGGAGAKAVVLWTLLGTSTLSSSPSGVTLTDAIVPSEPFTPPVDATQKPGPHPLGESFGEPVPLISVNDDRMEQVQYLNGHLYSSLNTGVGSGAAARSGVAWFDVKTSDTNGTVAHQGYLSTGNGASLMYPAIGVGSSGTGAMTFSVSGPGTYPSAAFIPFNHGPTGSAITVASSGVLPEDGFTCYPEEGFGPSCRWGDYSAASSDGSGHIVMGAEMIANTARDLLANWDTYISTFPPTFKP
jgi:hypothetical protein